MRVFLSQDCVVVCSLTDKNAEFLRRTAGCFDGFHRGNLKLNEGGLGKLYHLGIIIMEAVNANIEVSDEVQLLYDNLRKAEAEKRAKEYDERKAKEAREVKRKRWELLTREGCIGCAACRHTEFEDDWECMATREELPTKNCPGYEDMTYLLFNIRPFPTDSCPFKFEEQRGENDEHF